MTDIDPAAVKAAHRGRTEEGIVYHGVCPRTAWPCEPYRLAEALAAEQKAGDEAIFALSEALAAAREALSVEQAKVARVEELCVEWEGMDAACWADAQEIRAALAGEPEDVSP